ncbi:MAG: PadR family transcriptional regulator [Rhodospirillaceae bacterium]
MAKTESRRPNMSKQTRLLLETLLEDPLSWRHGYDISKGTGLKPGTLYPLLMRLGDLGYLASKWQEPEQPGRPPRHLYRLTGSGIDLAREVAQERGKIPTGKLARAGA